MNLHRVFLLWSFASLAWKETEAFAPALRVPATSSRSSALGYANGNGDEKEQNSAATTATSAVTSQSPAVTESVPVSASVPASEPLEELIKSVNYFISRECNYSCKFCFHTQKNVDMLTLSKAKRGLKMLKEAGTQKVNFAGGEPFINDIMLGELCRYAHTELHMAVSIISNASLIKPYWMELYGEYVDVLGVSIDSFSPEVNAQIGRGGGDIGDFIGDMTGNGNGNGNANTTNGRRKAKNKHLDRVLKVRKMCDEQNIIFKMNTVVCKLNYQEDMTEYVRKLNPKRWKCFQVLILEDENSGSENAIRDARELIVSKTQFNEFVMRHETSGFFENVLIPEPNDVMQNSYLLLDENMCFLDCSKGGKVPSESILDVGVEKALGQAGFDHGAFQKRGGVYEWTRERESDGIDSEVNNDNDDQE